MVLKYKGNASKQNVNNLEIRMGIALFAGLISRIRLLFLRESLIATNKESIWSIINNLFFQDISVGEGKNAIGIF